MNRKTEEDYLRVIYSLYEILTDKNEGIRLSDIAKELRVTKPTVSRAIKRLTENKLLESKTYSKINLSVLGLVKAQEIMYKHRLIEMFLIKKLNYNKEELETNVHEEAHELEHAFSDESIRRIDKLLNFPNENLSGKNIPRGENR